MTTLLLRCYAFFCAVILIISANTAVAGINQSSKTINIGIYAPFTSKSAYIGRNILGAMELARDQLKSSKINYEFYTLDRLPKKANQAQILQKFIKTHKIDVLLTEAASTSTEIAPLAKKNKLIHFCLGADGVITDGLNNFQTQSPNHKSGMVLKKGVKPEFVAQFKKEYFSHPVTEAGYAFDIFHLINNSVELAIKNHSDFSNKTLAKNILALESGTGLMGKFNLNKKGLSYEKEILVA